MILEAVRVDLLVLSQSPDRLESESHDSNRVGGTCSSSLVDATLAGLGVQIQHQGLI